MQQCVRVATCLEFRSPSMSPFLPHLSIKIDAAGLMPSQACVCVQCIEKNPADVEKAKVDTALSIISGLFA